MRVAILVAGLGVVQLAHAGEVELPSSTTGAVVAGAAVGQVAGAVTGLALGYFLGMRGCLSGNTRAVSQCEGDGFLVGTPAGFVGSGLGAIAGSAVGQRLAGGPSVGRVAAWTTLGAGLGLIAGGGIAASALGGSHDSGGTVFLLGLGALHVFGLPIVGAIVGAERVRLRPPSDVAIAPTFGRGGGGFVVTGRF